MLRFGVKLAFIFCFLLHLDAQDRYWVDESGQDLLLKENLTPFFCSDWLNICSYKLSGYHIKILSDNGCKVTPVRSFARTKHMNNKELLGFALEQVNAGAFIEQGLTGDNIKIGIIDGGFLHANSFPSLSDIFQSKRVIAYRDFITPEMEEYGGSAFLDDNHGTEVMQLIGGYDKEKYIQFGLATGSRYYLARTDHGGFERRQEEDLLIKALEWMFQQGIRIVNISLGYAKGYTNPRENYSPKDMNGHTSMVARAVDTAFYKKNMLVVVAAGNEGDDPKWQVLSTPGDAKGALTVGATKLKYWEKLDYSSIGPENLGYLKPEISCFASQGTSFSTPIITGIAAGIMEYDSTLTAAEIKMIIQQSGNLYPYGNNHTGYGVPDCKQILKILSGENTQKPKTATTGRKKIKIATEGSSYITVYHKKGINVIHREIYRPDDDTEKILRFENAEQSTVFLKEKCLEIIWK